MTPLPTGVPSLVIVPPEGPRELHNIWRGIRARCLNPRHVAYARYGGRGITICERWSGSFEAFVADVGERPAGCTLDRIDNNGNYEPGNVRWATWQEQQRNRRDNRLLTHNGRMQCLKAWAEEIGLTSEAISRRLRAGWSVDRAVSTGPLESHRVFTGQELDRECTRCHLVKPLTEFVKQRRSPTGHGPHCSQCHRAIARAYYQAKS